jgi:anti-sigma factor RsiW
MLNRSFHPAHRQLLLFADGELSPRRAGRVRAHLAKCRECRARIAEIEAAMEELVQLHQQVLDSRVPPAEGARAELRMRMAELYGNFHGGYAWLSFLKPGVIRFGVVCALAFAAVLGAGLLYRNAVRTREALRAFVGPLPNPSLTPGVTKSVVMSGICSAPEEEVDVPVTGNLQERVFQEYGISGTSASDYEVDYLISPGLGGADNIRNLWPEPRFDVAWNSFVKDQLENYLHHEVCVGRVKLSVAQREISGNWIAAYKKYFHTDRPISPHQAEVSSVPDVWNVRVIFQLARPVTFFNEIVSVPVRSSAGRSLNVRRPQHPDRRVS